MGRAHLKIHESPMKWPILRLRPFSEAKPFASNLSRSFWMVGNFVIQDATNIQGHGPSSSKALPPPLPYLGSTKGGPANTWRKSLQISGSRWHMVTYDFFWCGKQRMCCIYDIYIRYYLWLWMYNDKWMSERRRTSMSPWTGWRISKELACSCQINKSNFLKLLYLPTGNRPIMAKAATLHPWEHCPFWQANWRLARSSLGLTWCWWCQEAWLFSPHDMNPIETI